MNSRRKRNGTKSWKHAGHKSLEWFLEQKGISGKAKWERNGKGEVSNEEAIRLVEIREKSIKGRKQQ